MGNCCSTPAAVAPNGEKKDTRLLAVNPSGAPAAAAKGQAGHHWAEGGKNGDRRTARTPWQASKQPASPGPRQPPTPGSPAKQDAEVCEIANDEGFDFHQSFPMYVMKMETFMQMKKMRSFEDMLAEGLVFEWEPWMGRVWFMSHQWTSFSHPDPGSEQLDVAQQLMKTVMAGKMRDIFATEEEWQGYITREANRFLNFPVLTAEQLAEDAAKGYVWLDYASVPQAIEP